MIVRRAMHWFRAFFAWETHRDTGVWLYQQNKVTGARRVVRVHFSGYQPVDLRWLSRKNRDGAA
jgi:hypothetical protein